MSVRDTTGKEQETGVSHLMGDVSEDEPVHRIEVQILWLVVVLNCAQDNECTQWSGAYGIVKCKETVGHLMGEKHRVACKVPNGRPPAWV
jgi:hypothetical protein